MENTKQITKRQSKIFLIIALCVFYVSAVSKSIYAKFMENYCISWAQVFINPIVVLLKIFAVIVIIIMSCIAIGMFADIFKVNKKQKSSK